MSSKGYARSGKESKKIKKKRGWMEKYSSRGGAPVRAPHLVTKLEAPRKWRQPKWHRDLFGPEELDE